MNEPKLVRQSRVAFAAQIPALKVLVAGVMFLLLVDIVTFRVSERARVNENDYRAEAPASNWTEMTDIAVSNARQGEDPWLVAADRSYYFDGTMRMDWAVTIVHRNNVGERHLCSGTGSAASYSKKSQTPVPVPVLAWWMGVSDPATQCSDWPFPVGTTCMYTRWDFTPSGYPKKTSHAPVVCWQTVDADLPTGGRANAAQVN